ncbi:uncharacterized protein LOC130450442 [Diorhabda sublineata]|uniref:uncharacterized protein LOC130450442 n=1 Tax=Diorhabda sublineata TaxID=1163346 RepID=UPI0024E0CCE0|nr:uncharacterized protein LOC130450442 [Diorhabda sublineata]
MCCKLCNSKHNTSLHIAREKSNHTQLIQLVNSEPTPSTSETNCNFATADNAILCTANVEIKTNLTICGIGEKISNAIYKCTLKLRSISSNYSSDLNAFVLDNITSNLPVKPINRKMLKIPADIQLADPKFDQTREIDLLIGADLFWDIISEGKITLEPNGPNLQNTRIGWIVEGPSAAYYSNSYSLCNLEGRFVVSLPLKDSPTKLNNSRKTAIKRVISLERKLYSNETLRQYENLGHMTEIKHNDSYIQTDYYFPHHGVLKESSSTTKLRVVFDGSSPSSTGVSINDLQKTGPIIQSDLILILLRFRICPIVVSGDIRMMYRQVLIDPEQLQQTVWQSNPNKPIKTFQLNTVTYNTTA